MVDHRRTSTDGQGPKAAARLRRAGTLAAVAATALLAAACSSSSGSGSAPSSAASTAAGSAAASAPAAASGGTVTGSISLAVLSGYSYPTLPQMAAVDTLGGKGVTVTRDQLTSPDLVVQAVSSGSANLADVSMLSALQGIQKGAKITVLMDDRPGDWVIVAPTSVTSCKDMNGKAFGVTAPGTALTVAAQAWMKGCGANVNLVTIADSTDRETAMVHGELQASPLNLSDYVTLNQQQPGKFHILEKYNDFAPGLLTQVLVVNTAWFKQGQNAQLVTQYATSLLTVMKDANGDPGTLEPTAKKYETSAAYSSYAQTARTYTSEIKGFPADGGALTDAAVTSIISEGVKDGLLQPGLTAAQAFDPSILNSVEQAIG